MNHLPHKLLRSALPLLLLTSFTAHAELNVLIVEGLGGEAQYSREFAAQTKALREASTTLTSAERIQVLKDTGATRANVLAVLKQYASSLSKDDRLALYLVGHGSYDGYQYKFNLPGPDLSSTDLQTALNAIKAGNQLVVVTGSSSGALQEVLKQDTRVLVTATRNGNERNATHFGRLLAEALDDEAVDADKNGRVSVQEAFDLTARKVKDYFEGETRLVTEHAVLSGPRADAFTLVQRAEAGLPAATAANAPLLAEREQVNGQLEALRLRRDELGEDEYLKQLEPLLLQLAELDAQLSAGAEGQP